MSEAAPRAPYRTIPVRPETWERLKAYRMGGATYDQVLNDLMNALPIEHVSEEFLREARERLRTFDGIPLADLRKKYEKERRASRSRDVPRRPGSARRKDARRSR